jgi:Glycosyl hydrolase family 26
VLVLALLPGTAAAARGFGVYVDPWHVGEWAGRVGAAPDFVARFEAFSRAAMVDSFLREAERQGLKRVLVSWEPWRPVPPELGIVEQFRAQPGYRNRDIAAGAHDAYITAFARSLATFEGRVDLRYAHEMNGTWYPWSRDPIGYRQAWRRIVRLFRAAGASNVRFVWSPNPSLFLPMRSWRRSVRVYWPGRRYVDAVGSTMINFGGRRRYTVRRFVPRLETLRRTFRKSILITEANTERLGRVRWLEDLRVMLAHRPWIRALVWSQLPSRGTAHIATAGDLGWDVQDDRASAAVLRRIARDGAP